MSQNNSIPAQDAQFQKRRSQKNWIMLALVLCGAALVWSVTMLKIQNGIAAAELKKAAMSVEAPVEGNEGGKDAQ